MLPVGNIVGALYYRL